MFAIGDVDTHCKPFLSVLTVVHTYITVSMCTSRVIKIDKSIAIEIARCFLAVCFRLILMKKMICQQQRHLHHQRYVLSELNAQYLRHCFHFYALWFVLGRIRSQSTSSQTKAQHHTEIRQPQQTFC